MGATDFALHVITDKDAEATYRKIHAETQVYFGTNRDSGTIAATLGMVVRHATPVTLEQAQEMAFDRILEMGRDDPCEAIALVEETPAKRDPLPDREIMITMPGEVYGDITALRKTLAAALKVDPDQVDSWTIRDSATRTKRISLKREVDAVAPEGEVESRFFIVRDGHGFMPRWDKGYTTQAKAVADLESVLDVNWADPTSPIRAEIVKITRRVSGAPLVDATVKVTSVTATFTVTLSKEVEKAKVGTKRVGWYFYGMVPD